ncbi:hypothetical protein [Shewanella algae]|uniref:hypothetical protein n=1 Tax=Shewanella algae TaxID=38313 RepID=UPI001AAF145D|nr:hypothetical protein [Shewanella algae]MBO2695786.1 hypothetical protein [Shewanella algae]
MKALPINFNTEMMSAILEGRKTQTRRPVKPKIVELIEFMGGSNEENSSFDFVGLRHGEWKSDDGTVWGPEWLVYCTEYPEEGVEPVGELYGAIGDRLQATDGERTATIEITGFRVERLQEINEQDAIAEGMTFTDYGINQFGNQQPGWLWRKSSSHEECLSSAKFAFANLWTSIYGARAWSNNPWVWVIEFKVLTTRSAIGDAAA